MGLASSSIGASAAKRLVIFAPDCGPTANQAISRIIMFETKNAMRATHRLAFAAAMSAAAMLAIGAAQAHPHVWISAKAEMAFEGPNMQGVKHAWVFDEAFSTYVVQGLDANKDGQYSREELADLAKENVESLKEFDYFTFAKIGGKDAEFDAPRDYWLSFDGKLLTLNFTLPLKTGAPMREAVIEVYDPSYYVEFKFADAKSVTFAGGPAGCTALVKVPPAPDEAAQQKLAEADFNALDSSFSADFANRVILACP
jgi:ABC-type uncharacterized transport system substrate-binding protein